MARRRYQRPRPFRFRKRVVFVATEGRATERIYFEELKHLHRESVTILVSPGRAGEVNPLRVFERLQREIKSKATDWLPGDSAWLVVDTDHWTPEERNQVLQKIAQDSRTGLAASNPTFELWLLLHFRDAWGAVTASGLTALLQEPGCLGRFDKADYDARILLEGLKEAVARARKADASRVDEWPAPGTTQVHRCVAAVLGSKEP
jgi:hypothetical protein